MEYFSMAGVKVVVQFIFAPDQLAFRFRPPECTENCLLSPFLNVWAGRYQPTTRTQVIQSKNKLYHYWCSAFLLFPSGIHFTGMTCVACASAIEKSLLKIQGIKYVSANFPAVCVPMLAGERLDFGPNHALRWTFSVTNTR
jgi:hypothetical protein